VKNSGLTTKCFDSTSAILKRLKNKNTERVKEKNFIETFFMGNQVIGAITTARTQRVIMRLTWITKLHFLVVFP